MTVDQKVPDLSIATRASDADAVPSILAKIAEFGKAPSVDDNDTRAALFAQARALVRALQTPREIMIEHNWAQAGNHAAITACYNAGVFGVLGDKPTKVDEIASKLGKPREALARMLRHIAAMGYIKETDADEYVHTNFSKSLNIPIIGDAYPVLAGGCHPSCSKFPQYLEKTNYELSTDVEAGPYQFAFDTKMNMFQYLAAHPPWGKQFNHHMGGYRQGRPSWMDTNFYPVKEQLLNGLDNSEGSVLLVDIGGGFGHDIAEFRSKFPNAPGRLVLQDISSVIDDIKQLDSSIERQVYDFHTEQPLKGARAYYMHSVLHDWPDHVGKDILKQIAGAMKKGYSKLLINENVIPDRGADWQATALDMMMMTLFSSKERTFSDWKQLVESPELGLKIVRVWSVTHSQESIIEVELA